MGILNWLSRSKSEGAETPEQRAQRELEECKELVTANPKEASDTLYRLGQRHFDLLQLGSAMHESYRAAVQAAWIAQEPQVAPWAWPSIGAVAEVARKFQADAIYLTATSGRHTRDAMAQLSALRGLAQNTDVAMVVIGEGEAFIRRELLVQAGAALDASSEEVLPDLADFAKRIHMRVMNIVA